MDTREKLEQSLKDAMRSNDEMRKQNVRMVMSAVRLAEVEKGVKLDDAGVIAIIQKELKSRNESMEDARKANRADLIEKAQNEAAFLQTFLPRQMTEAELETIVREVIVEVGAATPADTGKVMKAIMPRVQGKAAGDQVSKAVRKLLQP